MRGKAYDYLEKARSFIDHIASIDQDAIDTHLAAANMFFEKNDNRVKPMDRLALASALSIKLAAFVTADHPFKTFIIAYCEDGHYAR